MRLAAATCALGILVCVAVAGAVLAQRNAVSVPASVAEPAAPPLGPVVVVKDVPEPTVAAIAAAPPPAAVAQPTPPVRSIAATPAPPGPAVAPPAPAGSAVSCAGNPNAIGVGRTVEIDTTGGPGFGFEHFKSHDFLRDGEVVLTFDDGPWPRTTTAVLAALAAHCTKAIFFPIGKHATYEPGILKQVAAAGHAIGSHTWSHKDLSKTSVEEARDEIEKGMSAVRWAAGAATAPYFRFPGLRHPPELVTYLGQRNVAIFSTDFDSFDFKTRKPDDLRKSVLARLKKHGKGIALMHDFQSVTAAAILDLLNDLKAGGYRVVFMKPKAPLATLAAYDEQVLKDVKLPTVDSRPTSTVVRTIAE
jgi:peptidoglycan/xylan/chitin deacetylase (PgdA/CDA1 family)